MKLMPVILLIIYHIILLRVKRYLYFIVFLGVLALICAAQPAGAPPFAELRGRADFSPPRPAARFPPPPGLSQTAKNIKISTFLCFG